MMRIRICNFCGVYSPVLYHDSGCAITICDMCKTSKYFETNWSPFSYHNWYNWYNIIRILLWKQYWQTPHFHYLIILLVSWSYHLLIILWHLALLLAVMVYTQQNLIQNDGTFWLANQVPLILHNLSLTIVADIKA